LQLARVIGAIAIATSASATALADDRVDLTTTWYQESRQGGQGGLTVIHPQFDLGVDAGEHFTFDIGYAADIVTGATATVYTVDAVSTATTFSDLRHQATLGMGLKGRRSQLGIVGGFGIERDYISVTAGGVGSIDLPGKNTNLALAYTHNFEQVCDKDNGELSILAREALTGADPCDKTFVVGKDHDNMTSGVPETTWRDLSIDTAQATVTQNVTPTLNLQTSLYGQVLQGFQSNPYRRVRVGPNEPQEHIPDVRARMAISGRVNKYIPVLRAAAHFDGRFYSDTWGVNGGTIELAYSQYAGSSLLLRVRARVHQQTAARFFKDAFFYETESSAGAYFTGDRELAPVRNILLGGKLSILSISEDDKKVLGLFEKLQLNVKGDILLLDELAANDPDSNLDGRDTQFLTSGQFIDAIVVQLGVLADY
jgi:hypothetical protein